MIAVNQLKRAGLSEALLRTFPELESVAEVLKGDVAAARNTG